MKNPEQIVAHIAGKQKTAFIGSIDEQGFPNIKAMRNIIRKE